MSTNTPVSFITTLSPPCSTSGIFFLSESIWHNSCHNISFLMSINHSCEHDTFKWCCWTWSIVSWHPLPCWFSTINHLTLHCLVLVNAASFPWGPHLFNPFCNVYCCANVFSFAWPLWWSSIITLAICIDFCHYCIPHLLLDCDWLLLTSCVDHKKTTFLFVLSSVFRFKSVHLSLIPYHLLLQCSWTLFLAAESSYWNTAAQVL